MIFELIELIKQNIRNRKAQMTENLLMWILVICAIIFIGYMIYKYFPVLTDNALAFQSQAEIK